MWEIKRFKCKGTMSLISMPNITNDLLSPNYANVRTFIEGKWYDGSYKIWSDDPIKNQERYRINNGWDEYAVIDEFGKQRFFTRAHFNAIFFSNLELRNEIIDEIISDKTQA